MLHPLIVPGAVGEGAAVCVAVVDALVTEMVALAAIKGTEVRVAVSPKHVAGAKAVAQAPVVMTAPPYPE